MLIAGCARDLQFAPSVGGSCLCVLYVMQLILIQPPEKLEPRGLSSAFSFVSILLFLFRLALAVAYP